METVLASLRHFDLRLELAITPAHYSDLFGDNWVNVREFAESICGRRVPEVSAMLVEIIIAYRHAQDISWIPENLRLMQSWWGEASRKRKWLADVVDSAQVQIIASPVPLDAEIIEEPKASPILEMAVVPPPALKQRPIPEMAVVPPPAPRVKKLPIPEMAVAPPPVPQTRPPQTMPPSPETRALPFLGANPAFCG